MMLDVLLLHGAIGASDQLGSLKELLTEKYRVHAINFNGHGGERFNGQPFSMESFANDVLDYLDKNNISSLSIFGYSMGGYVAMWLAKNKPGRINKIITLATKFHWDEETAAREVKMLDADTILAKVPAFAEQLKKRHSPNDWKELLAMTKEMLLTLGRRDALQLSDYASIAIPCLLLLGDKDRMVTREETEAVYRQLPGAILELLPNTPHPIEQVDTVLLAKKIDGFLQ